MDTQVGSRVTEAQATAWSSSLKHRMYQGEHVAALSKTKLIRPLADGVAVTTARVMGFLIRDISGGKIAVEVFAGDIALVDLKKRLTGSNTLIVRNKSGVDVSFGDLPTEDAGMILEKVQQLKAGELTGDPKAGASIAEDPAFQKEAAWRSIPVAGTRPTAKAWQAIREHSRGGEIPWCVVGGESAAGVLAAFQDRCMIIKVGAVAGMMSGTLGGGRITTFHYSEITGIEYNAGMMTGVLEILTASYQGSANKDYWRGAHKDRNANTDNPWALSNCLPMGKMIYQQALPLLNELRERISEVKHPKRMQPPAAQTPKPSVGADLAEQLGKLAALRDQGVLDQDEFQAAKRAVIAKYSG